MDLPVGGPGNPRPPEDEELGLLLPAKLEDEGPPLTPLELLPAKPEEEGPLRISRSSLSLSLSGAPPPPLEGPGTGGSS